MISARLTKSLFRFSEQKKDGLRFYYHLMSQPCRAVMALLALGKIPHQKIEVDIYENQARTPHFLKINQFATVPAILHEDLHLGESNAIMAYLCQIYPEQLGSYFGSTPQERAKVNDYLSWYQGTFRPGMLAVLFLQWKYAILKKEPVQKKQYLRSEKKMKEVLSKLETYLQGKLYLCGSKLTIADLLLFHQAYNIVFYNYDISSWKNVNTWYNRILAIEQINDIHQKFIQQLPQMKLLNQIISVQILEE